MWQSPVSSGFPQSLQPTARCPQHEAFQAHLPPSSNCVPQGSTETHTCSLAAWVRMPDHRFCKGQPEKSILCPLSCSECTQHVKLTLPGKPRLELLYKSTSAPGFSPSAEDSAPVSWTRALYDTEMNWAWLLNKQTSLLSHEIDACACVLSYFSRVWLFVTPGTVAQLVPLSMGFSRQNTGVGCHALLQGIFSTQGSNPGLNLALQVHSLLTEPPGKPKNTGVGSLSLLQTVFLT